MMFSSYQKICRRLLTVLPERQKEVIERRFGLSENGKRETLESIGQDFGVTRERIRQLANDGFSRLAKQKDADLKKTFGYFMVQLKKEGGAKREDILLENLGGEHFQNHAYFLLTLGDPFHRFSESEDFYSFWIIEKTLFQKLQETVSLVLKNLEREGKPVPQKNLLQGLSYATAPARPPKIFLSSLEIAKKIEKGPLGDFGLVTWPEVNPRGVRDKAYLALKKNRQPLHFTAITQAINELPAVFGGHSGREAQPQTVHNELIKDERFILVGRGIYALREWGYQDGAVQDVIAAVLKQAQKPLARQEVVKQVLAQRLVKPNTILLNLNNKKRFGKDDQGRYILKS